MTETKPDDKKIDFTAEKKAHTEAQDAIKLFCVLLRGLPLESYIARLKTAQTLGPIIDPTLFMRKGNSLAIEIEIAEEILESRGRLEAIAKREMPNLAKLAAADAADQGPAQ